MELHIYIYICVCVWGGGGCIYMYVCVCVCVFGLRTHFKHMDLLKVVWMISIMSLVCLVINHYSKEQ